MLSHIEILASNDLSHHIRSRRAEALTDGEIDTHVWKMELQRIYVEITVTQNIGIGTDTLHNHFLIFWQSACW